MVSERTLSRSRQAFLKKTAESKKHSSKALEKKVDDHSSQLEKLEKRLVYVEDDVNDLEQHECVGISPQLEKLERRLVKVEDDVDDLDNRVDTIFFKELRKEPMHSSSESFSDFDISVHATQDVPKKKRKYPGKKVWRKKS
jgi:chromosome segregation ATPase